jgi:hypothetical protein
MMLHALPPWNMPTMSVRISEEEMKRLLKYGPLSMSVRDALRLYLDARESQQSFSKSKELQKRNPIRTTTSEEVRMIKEDRLRHR